MEGTMKTRVWRHIVVGVLMLGLAAPGLALADGSAKGCQFQGTWFGFDPGTGALSGWVVTVAGQASNAGTNNLEYPNFDPSLGFLPATRISTLRGSWVRTGGNTFDYTMIGLATDSSLNIIWIGKLSGHITLSADCNTETIEDTTLEVFGPDQNPYGGELMIPVIHLPTHYGFRTSVDLPDLD
jgi:hypothetical protein